MQVLTTALVPTSAHLGLTLRLLSLRTCQFRSSMAVGAVSIPVRVLEPDRRRCRLVASRLAMAHLPRALPRALPQA